MSLPDEEKLALEVAAISELELLKDLEFSIRQHMTKKLAETAERVKTALARLDAKRKKQNARARNDF